MNNFNYPFENNDRELAHRAYAHASQRNPNLMDAHAILARDPDAPDPSDVAVIENMNAAIHDMVEHWADEVWPQLANRATAILESWARG